MTWHLHGTGHRLADDWRELHSIAAGWDASWADVNGFHLEPMPTRQPITTHLWAWAARRWLRVRIDGTNWWAALLTSGEAAVDDLWTEPEEVPEPAITTLRHWHQDEGQVHQFKGNKEVLNRDDFIQLTPLRPTTAAFIGHTSTHR
ncbi:hypothetical protein [Saccharopolyspora shandongensis]|uniref:hypothetical protein n=1 Tax=Saccharopolyspora shandongensis TaxID=418495 RepID=UPI0033E0D4FA